MVQRLAKGMLAPNTQIQKDAITAMSKGATVFVNHIADKYVLPFPSLRLHKTTIPIIVHRDANIGYSWIYKLFFFPVIDPSPLQSRFPPTPYFCAYFPLLFPPLPRPLPNDGSNHVSSLNIPFPQSQRNHPILQPQNHLPKRRPRSPRRMRVRRIPAPRRGRAETLQRDRDGETK